MAVVKNLMVRAGADFSGITKETQKAQQTLKGFQSSINSSMGKIKAALIGLGIGKAIKDATSSAMQYESSVQQISRIMGQNSAEFQKWANTQAKAYGMAKSEAAKYGAVYGNLISGFANGTGETTKYTIELLKASAVVASGTGRTMEDVMDRIRSGLLGNTEAIEDLGINVNVAMIESTAAFKKFAGNKSWQQLDFQTQQTIRYFAIMEQASRKYGDSLNQNTATNQQKFIAELKNIQLSFGQAFLPIYNIVIPALTNLASKLAYTADLVAQFSQALFGKGKQQAKTTDKQANAVGGLGDAYQEAGKQASGALAGFDEINSLADGTGSGDAVATPTKAGITAADDGTNGESESDSQKVLAEIQVMADTVRQKVQSVWDSILANKEAITSAIGGIVTAFASFETLTFFANMPIIIGAVGTAISGLLSPVAITAAAIGAFAGLFIYLYQTNEKFRNDINTIWTDIAKTFTGFWSNTLQPIGKYIIDGFVKPIAQAFKTNIVPVLSEMFLGASKILYDLLKLVVVVVNSIWVVVRPAMDLIKSIIIGALEIIRGLWEQHGQDLLTNVSNLIRGLTETFQLIWDNIINPIIQPALEMLTWLWDKHLKGLIAQVADFVMRCVNGALELYNGFIKPIIDWMVSTLGPHIASSVAFLVDVFGSFLASASDIIQGIFRIFGGLIDFIVGVFTGNWQKAWEGVKDIFGGIFDSLVGLVKLPLNLIIDAINSVIRGLNSINIDIPDWVPGFGGKSFGINIAKIPKLATGGITNGPMTAVIGDNPGGREVVSPLDDLLNMITSAVSTAMLSVMQYMGSGSNGSDNREIIMEMDTYRVARALIPALDREVQRMGYSTILRTE